MRDREFASFGLELAQVSTTGHRLTGYASVFNYPIPSGTEHFPQTTYVKPGAFAKTIKDNRGMIQVLFNHGRDPRFGELPIGTVTDIREDTHGLWTETELHDGPENDNLKAALSSGALRAMSIQFETMDEEHSEDRSERNIKQIKLWEYGPVTFPANAAATAQLHSMWDMAALLDTDQAESSEDDDRSTDEAAASLESDRLTGITNMSMRMMGHEVEQRLDDQWLVEFSKRGSRR